MGVIIGIDLGTTFSAVGLVDASGVPEIIRNIEGSDITPSVVWFDGDDTFVGAQAVNVSGDPRQVGNVAAYVKRQMGNDDFAFVPDSNNRMFRAEEVSAIILRYLVDGAEQVLGDTVDGVVITVPAYFADEHRNATKRAAEIAGLNVIRLINEPTAAALSFGYSVEFSGTLLVYDLGGGTFDVTVLRANGDEFDVLASKGDRNLGGFDFNNELYKLVEQKFADTGAGSIPSDVEPIVLAAIEDAKKRLTTAERATVFVSANGRSERITVTREEFESACKDLMLRTEFLVEDTLDAANLTVGDIDKVILVGGSTRMPMVVETVERLAKQKPDRTVHPDQAVALGAAIVADQAKADASGNLPALAGGKVLAISDVITHGLGVLALDDNGILSYSQIIEPNTPVPCQRTTDFSTSVDGQTQLEVQVVSGDDPGVPAREVDSKLGNAMLKYPSGRPKGSPITVVFSADIDQILHVLVIDPITGDNLGEMEIERTGGMSDAEVAQSRTELARASLW